MFAYQFKNNQPYHAYCRSQNVTLGSVRRWQDIPAVPVRAFKSVELSTFPVSQAAALFESSQTSGAGPSRHYLKSLTFYETALKSGFAPWVLPDSARMPFLILSPPPGEAPRSSLAWMLDVVKRKWGARGSDYFVLRGRLDEPRLADVLQKMEAVGLPVALLGTTIAFLSFFDYLRQMGKSFSLLGGSRIMDTGGMKTSKREISRPDFATLVQETLGIPEPWCINEYGMCEMSSQFYGKGRTTALEGPAWVRTLLIDPATGEESASGQQGLLRHFDLANVDSVMAIQTEDLGRRVFRIPSSEVQGRASDVNLRTSDAFVLLGRASDAELKGCSLSAEAFLA